MTQKALLALQDGSVFHGNSIGSEGTVTGEVVFNTAITGYQEILTDPSYCKQIITLTQPQIGNVGCNSEDEESGLVHASGLVIKELPQVPSNWREQTSLVDYLRQKNTVAISGIDTRRLTRLLRDKGAQNGCIMAGNKLDETAAIEAARAFPGLVGMDLAREVSTATPYEWHEGTWALGQGFAAAPGLRWRVAAYDFGIKRNILRILVDQGCEVTVVPAATPAAEILAAGYDGVFLSNGPGDPDPCDYAITAIREFLQQGVPVFGICLGHQLLALAAGAQSVKMKFGHHGGNHPVQDVATGNVMITSQNHCFAVAEDAFPGSLQVTHRSLFDGTIQGIAHRDAPAFGFQGHPEASPGPHDFRPVFDRFTGLMQARS